MKIRILLTDKTEMIKTIIYLILLLQFSCCLSQSKTTTSLKFLQGNWYKSKYDNLAFSVRGSTYQVFEDEAKYKITIKSNFIKLYHEDGTLISKYKILKLNNSILWEKTENGTTLKFIKKYN